MKRIPKIFLCAALVAAAAGCGAQTAKQATSPESVPQAATTPAPKTSTAPEQESATPPASSTQGKSISCATPDGWLNVPQDALPPGAIAGLASRALHAQVLVLRYKPDGKSATEQVAAFCEDVRAHGLSVTDPVTSKDGSSAYTNVTVGNVKGRFAVKHLSDDAVIVVQGRWPAANDEEASAAVGLITDSLAYR